MIIFPGEIFSFWKIVKKPDQKNNFKVGRNLISGVLSEDFGGGLCQLSSIIYHLSMIGGLKIIERHNHSIDIYQEHERFTPLGADSAVVFGYKDLRVQNNKSFPVRFSFEIKDDILYSTLSGTEKLEERDIVFEKVITGAQASIITKTRTAKGEEIVASSFYRLPGK